MSWIPLVGSAMGSILGGLVTDYCNSKSREPVATLSLEAEDREKSKEETYHPLHGSLEKTTSSPSPPPLPASYSWTRYAEQYFQGAAGRSLVSGLGILLAIPFVYLALVLSFPGCFLVFIVSGLVRCSAVSSSLSPHVVHSLEKRISGYP